MSGVDGTALFGLEGRAVLVAGAGGGGIGTQVCALLARLGADVVGLDIRQEALDPVREALAGTAGQHSLVVADVRDRQQVGAALDAALEASGHPLHGAVHVAGGMRPAQWAPLLAADEEGYDATFDEVSDLNLKAALITYRTAARRLPAGGSIVGVASVAGLTATPYAAAYAASKAALISLTRTAALEWGGAGIRVNAVAPGTIRTPKTIAAAGGRVAPDTPAERAALPLGTRGTPADIAGAVVFLLSDLARWITGQVLPVDGGSSALPSFLDADRVPVFVHNEELRARLRAEAAGGGAA